jgi:hypothetical protein
MATEYKIVYRNSPDDFGSLTIPEELVRHRLEFFDAALRDATLRLQEELKGLSPEEKKAMATTLIARHKKYFDEHFEPSNVALTRVQEAEEAWAAAQDPLFLTGLGRGDKELGLHEVLLSIAQIARDEVEPLLQSYRDAQRARE